MSQCSTVYIVEGSFFEFFCELFPCGHNVALLLHIIMALDFYVFCPFFYAGTSSPDVSRTNKRLFTLFILGNTLFIPFYCLLNNKRIYNKHRVVVRGGNLQISAFHL